MPRILFHSLDTHAFVLFLLQAETSVGSFTHLFLALLEQAVSCFAFPLRFFRPLCVCTSKHSSLVALLAVCNRRSTLYFAPRVLLYHQFAARFSLDRGIPHPI